MPDRPEQQPRDESQLWPNVHCTEAREHAPHRHVNGAGHGCGLPEWCDGSEVSR